MRLWVKELLFDQQYCSSWPKWTGLVHAGSNPTTLKEMVQWLCFARCSVPAGEENVFADVAGDDSKVARAKSRRAKKKKQEQALAKVC